MNSNVDPLAQLANDRAIARENNDGWAALCTLGTVNAEGDVEQRTLVLREIQSRLALFFSARSPKWQELQQRPTCSLQLYLPTIQVQYRIRAAWEKISPDVVHQSWSMRPDIPKRLDWLYQQYPQSSALDRTTLLAQLEPETPVPACAPASALGVFLNPLSLERLQLSAGVHERERWELRSDQGWSHTNLVP